jgi:hypothetical protein
MDGLGIELAAKQNRPARLATMAKSSNNTAVQYGPRFATLQQITQCFLWYK